MRVLPARRVPFLMRHDGAMTDPAELHEVARSLAAQAGELILAGRAAVRVTHTKSSAIDIVTQMDIASEQLLRTLLADLRPHDGILGEEGDDVHGTSGVTWVLDPIDGTVNYVYGLPHFGVSVAAVTGEPRTDTWTPLVGAVYDGSGRLWSAGAGLGAWLGDEPLRRTEAPDLANSLVGTGFQYIAERRAVQGAIVAKLLPHVRDIRRLGAAAIDLCLVAAGSLDAYYEHGLRAWDLAAGALIATEAGVRVGGVDGGPPDEHLTIAAMPAAWEQLRDAVVGAGGDHPFGNA
jgi:myo-inositol-1(or 4)-monophosphatase